MSLFVLFTANKVVSSTASGFAEAAWPQWVARKDAERALARARGQPRPDMDAVEAAARGYWLTYLQARVRLMPALAETLDADLEGKMRAFYLYRR